MPTSPLFALVLFFVGTSSKPQLPGNRLITMELAIADRTAAIISLLLLPIQPVS